MAMMAAALASAASLAACGRAQASTQEAKSAQLTTVTVAIPVTGVFFLPFYVGQYSGIYRQAHLRVHLQVVPTSAEPAALLSNTVQFVGSLGYLGNAIAGNPTVYPEKIVEVSGVYAPFVLVGAKGVTSLKQLEGQVIAGDTGQPNQVIQTVLTLHKIPANSYTLANVSASGAARFELVQAGKAAAALVDVNSIVAPPVKGYPVLATGKGVRTIGAGLAVSDAEIKNNKSLVRRMVVATAKATHVAVTNEAVAVNALRKGLASQNLGYTTQQWKGVWKEAKYIFTSNGRPSTADQHALVQKAQVADKLPSMPSATTVFDLSFLPKNV